MQGFACCILWICYANPSEPPLIGFSTSRQSAGPVSYTHLVAAALAETDDAIAVLPQPFVTTAMMQNDKLRIALSLTDEWNKLDNGSTLVTGVTIIRTDVLEENPAAVEKFLEEYEASINYTETNAEDAAKLIAQYEICLLYTS